MRKNTGSNPKYRRLTREKNTVNVQETSKTIKYATVFYLEN